MKPRLLVTPSALAAGSFEAVGDDHHYLFRVLRLRPGDPLVLFDGEGREAQAEVSRVDGTLGELRVTTAVVAPPTAPPRLTMLLSIIKGDRMDFCLPKLVELGVGRIVPVAAERSVVKLDEGRAERRLDRYRAQVRAAAQQSRSPFLPVVDPVSRLPEAIARVAGAGLKLVLWEEERAISLRSALPPAPPGEIAVLVGPEGGWTDEEVVRATAAGFQPVGLGARILRAETAAVASAAILAYALGDI